MRPARSPAVVLLGRVGACALLAVCVLLGACAHGEPFAEGVLRKGDVRVQVGPVPAGWRRVSLDGADLAFRDDAREGSTLLDVRCGRRDDDAPPDRFAEGAADFERFALGTRTVSAARAAESGEGASRDP